MKSFKGQAALEFMMTYGWAILVVLAAIGALSYFGILNPSRFTPDTCLSSSGFACPGKPIVTGGLAAGDGNVTFSLVNGLGYKVNLNTTANTYLTLTPAALWAGCVNYICIQGNTSCTTTGIDIEDGSGATVRLTNCTFTGVQVVKGEARFSYINPSSKLTETVLVSITGKSKQ